ncbi:hypothetical protein VSX64_14615 [Aurantimonas sp. C2-6-R+9]|uniref:hypothetical protein n=1 Tax=unclassified Aurantimonas TaxID=2638230 RepID=UPI002E16FB95|nr:MULTISPECIES: hypothetical protein [unclassified Aurantimonas]MEC5291989.1 hypothetical protein [Aurantimonas sp. C2-3-R2]MEC5382101.1 hypothetical protein [Aurantimonas sp. C2-6-R+9]MEC5413074.1 hypothetical protein [Aurantimonas sp. C2-4-R8]
MRRRTLTLQPGSAATVATTATLICGAAVLYAVHPLAAAAWLGSTALMTWTHA